jgi:hypothetical protein
MVDFLSRAGKVKRARRGGRRGRHGAGLADMVGRGGGSVVLARMRRLQNVSCMSDARRDAIDGEACGESGVARGGGRAAEGSPSEGCRCSSSRSAGGPSCVQSRVVWHVIIHMFIGSSTRIFNNSLQYSGTSWLSV